MQNAAGEGARKPGASVQGVNSAETVTLVVTATRDELIALACAQECLDEQADAAITDRYRDGLREASRFITRILDEALQPSRAV